MMAFCRIGLHSGEASQINVSGFSTGFLDTAFLLSQGGVFSIRGGRTETTRRLAVVGETSAAVMTTISDVHITSATSTDGIDIEYNWGGTLVVSNTMLMGKIYCVVGNDPKYPLGFNSICLEGVQTFGPVLLDGNRGSMCHYDIRGCALLDAKGSPKALFGPTSGTVGAGPIPVSPVPEPAR